MRLAGQKKYVSCNNQDNSYYFESIYFKKVKRYLCPDDPIGSPEEVCIVQQPNQFLMLYINLLQLG